LKLKTSVGSEKKDLQQDKESKTASEQVRVPYFKLLESARLTRHWGGISATRRLLESCNFTPGQYVLDIGCGTGYTSCLLASEWGVNVVAMDISSKLLDEAKERIRKKRLNHKVTIVAADAHDLPFPACTFDTVIAESVLVFCDKRKVSSEVYRILKPNGVFAGNEPTYLKPPPEELVSLFLDLQPGIATRPVQEDELLAIFRESGFVGVSGNVYPYNRQEQTKSDLKMYGIRSYLAAFFQVIFDPTVRKSLFNKDALKTTGSPYAKYRNLSKYSSYLGYALYSGKKG
jgi:ubiquinone/menaquinone biosynthesis C-methylase UbiE